MEREKKKDMSFIGFLTAHMLEEGPKTIYLSIIRLSTSHKTIYLCIIRLSTSHKEFLNI